LRKGFDDVVALFLGTTIDKELSFKWVVELCRLCEPYLKSFDDVESNRAEVLVEHSFFKANAMWRVYK